MSALGSLTSRVRPHRAPITFSGRACSSTTRSPAASSRSLPRMERPSACTRAGPRSTTPRTSATSAPSSSRICCVACCVCAAGRCMQVMNLTDVDDKIITRAAAGEDDPRGHRAGHRDLSSRSRVSPNRDGRGVSEGDGAHSGDDRARRAAHGARARVSGGGRIRVLRDRALSRLRKALAARHARDSARARASRRTTTPRRTCRTSRSGRRRSRRTSRPAPRGIRRGDAAVPAGTSSARRWRSAISATRSTSTRGGVDLDLSASRG